MKKFIMFVFALFSFAGLMAQQMSSTIADSTTFKCTVSNKEYKVYMQINLYDNTITVPGQEIIGEIAGYIGHETDSRKWFIVSSKIIDNNTAELQIINDYGSEDLIARLTHNEDGTYTLRQMEGSTIKFAVNKKWAKLPKSIQFSLKQGS